MSDLQRLFGLEAVTKMVIGLVAFVVIYYVCRKSRNID